MFYRLGSYGMGMLFKTPEDGAREGAEFIKNHIIRVTEKALMILPEAKVIL